MTDWKKCEDQMPEKDGRYLVTETYDYPGFKWVGVCSVRAGRWHIAKVTHWMELPEAGK